MTCTFRESNRPNRSLLSRFFPAIVRNEQIRGITVPGHEMGRSDRRRGSGFLARDSPRSQTPAPLRVPVSDTQESTAARPPLAGVAGRLATIAVAGCAALFFLVAIHAAATSVRCDRGWSESLPRFGAAAFAGLAAATAFAWIRRRPLPDARAFVAVFVSAIAFAWFAGKLPAAPSIADFGRPPALDTVYLAATAVVAAILATVVPARPVEGLLWAALIFSTPATRVLLRWSPDGLEAGPIGLAFAGLVAARASAAEPFRWPRLAAPAAAFGAWVLVSGLFSSTPMVSVPAVARTAAQICAFLVVAEAARRDGLGARLLGAFALVGSVVALVELGIFADLASAVGVTRARAARLEPFGIHPNLVAPFTAVAGVACAGAALALRRIPIRIAALGGWAVCAVAVALHRSGGATVGLAAGTLALLCGAMAVRWKRLATPFACAVAALPLVLVLVALAVPVVVRPLVGGGDAGSLSVGTRRVYWEAASRAIVAHPVLGLGPKNVEPHTAYLDENVEANQDWTVHPHNLYLELGETLGIPGLLAFLALAGAGALALRRGLTGGPGAEPRLAVAGAAMLVAILADAFFDHGFAEFAVVSDAFWWSLALIVAAAPDRPVDAPSGRTRGTPLSALACISSVALLFGCAIPVATTALEQSAKWIHYWFSVSGRLDTIRDLEGRVGRLEAALRLSPGRADLRLSLGESMLLRGLPGGLAEIERAVADAPHTAEVLLRAAGALIDPPIPPDVRSPERARALYARAARCGNPSEQASAQIGLVRCLAMAGDVPAARAALGAALAQDPGLVARVPGFRKPFPGDRNDPRPTPALFRASPEVDLPVLDSLQIVIDELGPSLDDRFDAVWGRLARIADVLVWMGRTDRAIELLTLLESKAPTPRSHLPSRLGQIRTELGRFEEALLDIARADAATPGGALFYILRSRAYEGLGRFRDARREAESFLALRYDPTTYVETAPGALRTAAFGSIESGDPLVAAASLDLAARFERDPWKKLTLLVESAGAAARARPGAPDAEAGAALDAAVDRGLATALAIVGSFDWLALDVGRIGSLGFDLGVRAGTGGRALFERHLPTVDRSPSAGARIFLAGVGEGARSLAGRAGATDDAGFLGTESSRLLSVSSTLAPEPARTSR